MAEFEHQDLSGSRFINVDLSGSRFHNVDLTGARIRGALLLNVELDGDYEGLTLNGVEVGPLVDAELNRRHPDRVLMRPTDAAGYRAAWAAHERLWPITIARARALSPAQLHERVEEEWSFTETLRHLVFVVDAWVSRALLGEPAPYHALVVTHGEMDRDTTGVPQDPDARPSLDEVVDVLEGRMAIVHGYLGNLTDSALDGSTPELPAPGYPAAGTYAVRRCLRAVINEFWEHRMIAERDLAILEHGPSDQAGSV